LRKFDHICGVELLGKVHHDVCIILLITVTSSGEQGTEGVNGYGIALLGTSCLTLITAMTTCSQADTVLMRLTQAASHLGVESEMTWAMRLLKREGAAVTDPATEKTRRRVEK